MDQLCGHLTAQNPAELIDIGVPAVNVDSCHINSHSVAHGGQASCQEWAFQRNTQGLIPWHVVCF